MKIAIVGAGPGGYVAAVRAAQHGADVTVVEAAEVGGTCLNWGCIPTKALLGTVDTLARVRDAASHGLEISGDVGVNVDKVMARKDRIVAAQAKGIRTLLKSWGVRLIPGKGRLKDATTVAIEGGTGGGEELTADRILIATGSRPAEVRGLPRDGTRVLTSDDAVHLRSVPQRILIVGAGAIGCEFAFIYRELGAEVTLLEAMSRAVPGEDEEISSLLEREFKKRRITFLSGATIEDVDGKGTAVTALLAGGNTLESDVVLVAAGRAVNTEGLGLPEVGVAQGARGEILVNEHMETSVPGIYAVGDVTGGTMLAHLASREGRVAVDHMMGDAGATMSYRVVPSAIFTRPEIGSVGMREHQVAAAGKPYRVGRFPFRALGKAHATGEIAGLIKIIAEEETDRILGTHIIGPHASDLVHETALAMEAGTTAGAVAAMIHAHPTLAEGIMEACGDVHGMAAHLPKTTK